MNTIKKLFGYAILATLVTVGSLNAQTQGVLEPCVEPDQHAPLAVGLWVGGAGATAAMVVDENAGATGFLAGMLATFVTARIVDQRQAEYESCVAWRDHFAFHVEDHRRAAELRRKGEERTRLHLIRLARLQAETDSVADHYGFPRPIR